MHKVAIAFFLYPKAQVSQVVNVAYVKQLGIVPTKHLVKSVDNLNVSKHFLQVVSVVNYLQFSILGVHCYAGTPLAVLINPKLHA